MEDDGFYHTGTFHTMVNIGKQGVRSGPETCSPHRPVTDPDRGEVLCSSCGLVLRQNLEDPSNEGRRRESASDIRTGAPTRLSMSDHGLSTIIGHDRDFGGRPISGRARHDFARMRTHDLRCKTTTIQGLGRALMQLNGIRTRLHLSESILEDAAYLYRKGAELHMTRGRSTALMACAAIYAACRSADTPRTIMEIARAGNVERKLLARVLRDLVWRLDITLKPYDTAAMAVRMANNLGVRERTKRDALEMLERARSMGISAGKHPVAQAAAALYLAGISNNEDITQKRVADESGVSSVTIRSRVAAMRRLGF